MNAPAIRRLVIDHDGRVGTPAESWRDFIASERARLVTTPSEGLGSHARRLFRALALYDQPRHPSVPLLHWPVLRQVALAAYSAYAFARLSHAVARSHNRPALQQAWDIVRLAWREHLDAQTYYMQELYKIGGKARAAETLTRYETKNGLFTALKRLAPRHSAERSPLGDKLAFHARCRQHDIPTVPVYLSAIRGQLAWLDDGHGQAFDRGCDLFVKPRQGKGARGTTLLRYAGAGRYRLPGGALQSLGAYLDDLAQASHRRDYLLQPRLVNHADIADLATESLIVIRVITCLDAMGMPQVTHGMLRVIGKLERTWNDATEYAAPIDLATGRMGAMTGDKLEAALTWHDRHPLTGAPVAGRILNAWPAVQAAALKAHAAFTDRILLGWDIAVTPDGIVIVEGNAMPDVAFLQRVHRQAIGNSPLGGLLRHHLKRLERA